MNPALAMHRPALAPVITPRLDPDFTARPLLDGLLEGRFTALGETHALGDPIDWRRNPSADIEWQIVLHKFYHAPGLAQAFAQTGDARYAKLLRDHWLGWIEQIEPGFIAADVTGRRIQNWVYALDLYTSGKSPVDHALLRAVEASLAEQAAWLRGNLHAARNHRTLELFALLLAGVWLGDAGLAGFAMTALADNAARDFLPDGVHVELSSHYHCLALRNLIDAAALARGNDIAVPAALEQAIARASHFARVLHKPDGLIPALGDADTGDHRDMLPAGPAPRAAEVFPDAGYVFLRDRAALAGDRDGGWLVLDCGPLGEGNHGHLDCLSFELAARGRSLIVDPGRYTYFEGGTTNQRAAFRGTGAHNVVQVDGLEQTAYRQAPKRMKIAGPAPSAQRVSFSDRHVHGRAASAQHDAVQDRQVSLLDCGWWLVFDRMTSPSPHRYDFRLQLSPEAQGRTSVSPLPCGTPAVHSPDLLVAVLASHPAELTVEQGWIAPAYGVRHAAPRINARMTAASGWFAALLVPFAGDTPRFAFFADERGYRVVLAGGTCLQGHFPC